MPIIPEIQDRLLLAFPASSNVMLARAVQEGAYAADHLYDGESFLNNQLGRDIRGHVRRIGIAYQIELYCTRGDLPFISQMKPMPKGPWHWLELISTGAIAHVCQTADVMKFPEEAESRQDARLSIQKSLLTWMDEKPIGEVIREIPRLYAWLTFRVGGDGRLSHLCWAAPAADGDDYIGHINVLDQIAASGAEIPATTAAPDPTEKLRLKDHVAAALKKGTDKVAAE